MALRSREMKWRVVLVSVVAGGFLARAATGAGVVTSVVLRPLLRRSP